MENSIAIRNPELAKQWHETKNGKLTPFHVTVGSNKKHGGNVRKDTNLSFCCTLYQQYMYLKQIITEHSSKSTNSNHISIA